MAYGYLDNSSGLFGGLLGNAYTDPMTAGFSGAAAALAPLMGATRMPSGGIGAALALAGSGYGAGAQAAQRTNLQNRLLGLSGDEAANKLALSDLDLAGYRRLAQLHGGAPPSGSRLAAMGLPGPDNVPTPAIDPNAVPGAANSAFTGANPDAPGAAVDLRPAPVAAPLGGASAPLPTQARLAGAVPQSGAAPANLAPVGPGSSSGPALTGTPTLGQPSAGQPPPLFGVNNILQDIGVYRAMPSGGAQMGQLISMLPKVAPNSYLAQDGSVQSLPNASNVIAGQSYADAFGKNAAEARFAGPIASAKEWAAVQPKLTIERGTPRVLRGPGATLTDATGNVLAQVPFDIKGIDPNGAQYGEYRYMGVNPNAPNGGLGNAPTPGAVPSAAPPSPTLPTGVSAGGFLGASPQPPAAASHGLLNNSPPAAAGGGQGQGLLRVQTGLPPMTEAALKKRGTDLEEYGSGLQTNATNAVNQQFLIDQMRRESGDGAGWVPGKFADWAGDARALFNGAGISTDKSDAALANYQAFEKNSMQLTTAATRAVSPRAAVQEMQMIRTAMPGSKTSNGGLGYMFDQFSANNDFQSAKAQAADKWRPTHGQTLDGFESDWNQHVSPFAFLVHRMSEGDLSTMVGNLQKTAQGRALISKITGEVTYAQKNGLFQDGGQ